MTTTVERGRFPIRAGAVGLGLCALGTSLAYLGILPPIAGFTLFTLGGLIGAIGAIGGAWTSFQHGLNAGRRGIFLGILPAIALVVGAMPGFGAPPINDISTDRADPPEFAHAPTLPGNEGRDMAFLDELGPIIKKTYPDMVPLRLEEPRVQVFSRAALLVGGVPRWSLTYIDDSAGVIEGTAESAIFRFIDDFVIRVRPNPTGGTLIDMRSKSRDGQGDLGANANRIRNFLGKLAASSHRRG